VFKTVTPAKETLSEPIPSRSLTPDSTAIDHLLDGRVAE